MRNALQTVCLAVLAATLVSCSSWRVNSFIVEHEGMVLPASDAHSVQFLSDFAEADQGAGAVLGTQGKPDYIFVERQSVFSADIIKLAYIDEDRLVVLRRSANDSTATVESGIPENVAGLFTRDDRNRLARIRGLDPAPQHAAAGETLPPSTQHAVPSSVDAGGEQSPKETTLEGVRGLSVSTREPEPTSTLRSPEPTPTQTRTPKPTDTPTRQEYNLPLSVGNWRIELSEDPMTDRRFCTGFYKNRRDVQLNDDAFYISFSGRGGIAAVTLRFDDEPARRLRLATDVEKRISALNVTGSEFKRLIGASRLRAQVVTVLDRVILEDLDLSGIQTAYKILSSPSCN